MSAPTRTPQRTARRREQILSTARTLFAAEGIAQVTTGRIAEVAGISPGNLYYWFANKGEIVQALFDEWAARSAVDLDAGADPSQVLQTLWHQGPHQAQVTDEYAFFARELFPLLHVDTELAERYRQHVQQRTAAFAAQLERLVEAGLLRPPAPPTTLAQVVAVAWLVAETAPPFAAAVGAGVLDPTTATRVVVGPLLTASGWAVLGADGPGAGSREEQR